MRTKALTMYTPPCTLPGATRFSTDEELGDPFTLINLMKSHPDILNELRQAAAGRLPARGPKRMPGCWPLVYLTFITSRVKDIQPWYQRNQDFDFWIACGFDRIPSYRLVHLRLTELEGIASTFTDCAKKLIKMAHQKEPRVGAWLHVDSTEAETHARAHHDCQEGDPCTTRGKKSDLSPSPMDLSVVRELRERAAEDAPDAAKVPTHLGYTQLELEGEEAMRIIKGGKRPRIALRRKVADHWVWCYDLDAAVRAYTRGNVKVKMWNGYYQFEIIDHFTMAPIASWIEPANMQEPEIYERAFEGAVADLGIKPLIVAGDRGFSVNRIYKFNSARGVASAFPYRRASASEPKRRTGTALYDEHGIPRCKYCSGETRQTGFSAAGKLPRLWFKCSLPIKPECQKTQTISCTIAPRFLLPLWRNEIAYTAMRASHSNYEAKHSALRIQYGVGPNNNSIRPKRVGIAWQRLRAAAAMIVEWARVLRRAGWDAVGRAVTGPVKLTKDGGMLDNILNARARRRQTGLPPPGTLAA